MAVRSGGYAPGRHTWMNILTAALSLVGLALLVAGARQLVVGAARLAAVAGVPPLVVGLTVVAFGTSAPEMAVSVRSAWSGQADMAVGNVIGSNIFNVLFILGMSAVMVPLSVAADLVRRDVPLMIGASLVVLLMSLDGQIGGLDGVLLVGGLLVYTAWLILAARRVGKAAAAPVSVAATRGSVWADIARVVIGLAMLVLGSTWLVDGAVAFARWLEVDEVVVSLTVVAAGTSLPEVATSLTAAARGERDIAIGNVVGSNLFNLLGVLGASALVSPAGLGVADAIVAFDMPVMVAAAIACLPLWARARTIPRWEGALMLGYFVAYEVYLVLEAAHHQARDGYTAAMLQFVLPLTGVGLGFVAWRTWRR